MVRIRRAFVLREGSKVASYGTGSKLPWWPGSAISELVRVLNSILNGKILAQIHVREEPLRKFEIK